MNVHLHPAQDEARMAASSQKCTSHAAYQPQSRLDTAAQERIALFDLECQAGAASCFYFSRLFAAYHTSIPDIGEVRSPSEPNRRIFKPQEACWAAALLNSELLVFGKCR